jgi:hypothetical protein
VRCRRCWALRAIAAARKRGPGSPCDRHKLRGFYM